MAKVVPPILAALIASGQYDEVLPPKVVNAVYQATNEQNVAYFPDSELTTIKKAANRNGVKNVNDLALLLAIRKHENGGPGLEFGVTHPRAKNTDLNTQAGWAAATVRNQHGRFGNKKGEITPEFIDSLADRYCPPEVDPEGNKNWKKNVPQLYEKFKYKKQKTKTKETK